MRARSDVTVMLVRPKTEVSPDLKRLRGETDAPVTIVEFADFQAALATG